jgi:hypothetical protein
MPERRRHECASTIVSHEIGVSHRPTGLPTDLVEAALHGLLSGRCLIGRHRRDLQQVHERRLLAGGSQDTLARHALLDWGRIHRCLRNKCPAGGTDARHLSLALEDIFHTHTSFNCRTSMVFFGRDDS